MDKQIEKPTVAAAVSGDGLAQPVGMAGTAPNQNSKIELMGTRQLSSWMYEQRVSFAFTTYQSGKLFFVGLQPDGLLSIFERSFNRSMGLCASADAQSLYLSDLCVCWRFENALQTGQNYKGYDKLYVPKVGHVTGDIDIHDLAIDAQGNPIFVNTLFSCISTISSTHSFKPLWKPKFISKLAAEDRCHLNGLAVKDGKPRYVTAVSATDAHEAWREHRRDGGIVIDVETNEIVLEGLAMPHSPRLYQDKLWLINSGTGYFGYVDFQNKAKTRGKFEPIAFCSGYARGLAFIGDFAIVGVSKQRENRTFTGLPLDDELIRRKAKPKCGLLVIDLRTGDVVHSLQIDGGVEELYDVVTLPNVFRPMAIGFRTDEIRRMLTIDEKQQFPAGTASLY